MKQFKILICIFIFVNLIGITHVYAQVDSTQQVNSVNRFSVLVGGFGTGLNSDLIVGSKDLGLGFSINVEDALGLKTNTLVLRAEGEYNFGKSRKHQLGLSYFQLLRRASKSLGSELEIGDNVYPVGTTISSKFYLKIYKLNYNYAFFQDDRMRLGASFGLFVMPISFSIESTRMEQEFFSFIAPLPVFGLSTDFNITPKWTLSQSIELLYLEISSFQGSILDVDFRLDYKPMKHIAVGAGVNAWKMNLEVESESSIDLKFVGAIKTSYTGLMFYIKYFM